MSKDENKNSEQPATLPDARPGEEELKDYDNRDEDLLDNTPEAHPAPSPTKNN